MNTKENKLAAELLGLASQTFGNHRCNDVDESYFEGWTIEERRQFVKEYHEYNGDPEEYDENYLYIPDYALMDFMAHKLSNETPSL